MPRGPHDDLPSGSRYNTALVPGGAIRHAFQSYISPCMEWYVDLSGCFLDVLTRFNVMHAWVVSVSHSCMGQSWSVDARPLTKWFLYVWMALSAACTLWLLGSTNCHLQSSFLRFALSTVVAWLLVTLNCGFYPFAVRSLKISSNADMIVSSFKCFIGIAKMTLVS